MLTFPVVLSSIVVILVIAFLRQNVVEILMPLAFSVPSCPFVISCATYFASGRLFIRGVSIKTKKVF